VTRKLRGEKSSMKIHDLMPSMERTLWGMANLPKGALHTKATGPSRPNPYKNHCLVAVNLRGMSLLSMTLFDQRYAAYLYIDNQSRSDSPRRRILPVPSRRQTTQT
jgi:hypothetical protein